MRRRACGPARCVRPEPGLAREGRQVGDAGAQVDRHRARWRFGGCRRGRPRGREHCRPAAAPPPDEPLVGQPAVGVHDDPARDPELPASVRVAGSRTPGSRRPSATASRRAVVSQSPARARRRRDDRCAPWPGRAAEVGAAAWSCAAALPWSWITDQVWPRVDGVALLRSGSPRSGALLAAAAMTCVGSSVAVSQALTTAPLFTVQAVRYALAAVPAAGPGPCVGPSGAAAARPGVGVAGRGGRYGTGAVQRRDRARGGARGARGDRRRGGRVPAVLAVAGPLAARARPGGRSWPGGPSCPPEPRWSPEPETARRRRDRVGRRRAGVRGRVTLPRCSVLGRSGRGGCRCTRCGSPPSPSQCWAWWSRARRPSHAGHRGPARGSRTWLVVVTAVGVPALVHGGVPARGGPGRAVHRRGTGGGGRGGMLLGGPGPACGPGGHGPGAAGLASGLRRAPPAARRSPPPPYACVSPCGGRRPGRPERPRTSTG